MDEFKGDVEAYLRARLAEGRHRPDLHRHIIPVYTGYLKMIMERPDDYAREAGDMFAVMQAEQRDRAENMADLSRRMQHTERVRAWEARAGAAAAATGYGDLYTKLEAARLETEPLLAIEDRRRDLLTDLMRGIVAWRAAIAADRPPLAERAAAAWRELAALDADFGWQRLREWPPYRRCLYYNDRQLELLERWFTEATA